jgi:hypothetical protein
MTTVFGQALRVCLNLGKELVDNLFGHYGVVIFILNSLGYHACFRHHPLCHVKFPGHTFNPIQAPFVNRSCYFHWGLAWGAHLGQRLQRVLQGFLHSDCMVFMYHAHVFIHARSA